MLTKRKLAEEQYLLHRKFSLLFHQVATLIIIKWWLCNVSWLSSYEANTAWKVSVFGAFLVRIFPHSDWIRRDTKYISVFRPNAGKYGPEKLQIRTHVTQFEIIENFFFYDQPWAGESMFWFHVRSETHQDPHNKTVW